MNLITNWSLSFEEQIARRMWPQEAHGGFYLDVLQLADETATVADQPHAIAAIFLYQQFVEEILYLVDYWCFYEQALALYPTPYSYHLPERLFFGQILSRIQHQQDFPRKSELLQHAQKLNTECRIPAAHKLMHCGTLTKVESLAQQSKALFQQILDCFSDIRTHFESRYDLLAERTGIQRVHQTA